MGNVALSSDRVEARRRDGTLKKKQTRFLLFVYDLF